MKYFIKICLLLIAVALFSGCGNSNSEKLQKQVDSLSVELQKVKTKYKPGLGEFMTGIQLHHSKLWFAGINKNWDLAKFELDEIRELMQTAKELLPERSETEVLPILIPPLDSLGNSIDQKNVDKFKSDYKNLTGTCNDCHQTVNYPFNVIKIPTREPVVDQEFKPVESK